MLTENAPDLDAAPTRRHLSFAAIGVSEQGISHQIDALLADGFGRDRAVLIVGTDASLVTVAERLDATRIATLDRAHFHVVRPAPCEAFELVPVP